MKSNRTHQHCSYRPTYASSRILDGAHWLDATKTGGQLRFLATFSSSSGAPQAINVTVASTVYVLTLHLGEAGRGTYSVDVPASVASSGCVSYFFQATTTSGNWRVPEVGSYLTSGINGCTGNYLAAGAPLPTPTTAPTSPPVVISNAPTRQPSQAPTVGSSLAPSATPTKQPSQAPSKQPSQAPTLATDPYSLTNAPSVAPSTEPVSVPSQVGQDRWDSLIKP